MKGFQALKETLTSIYNKHEVHIIILTVLLLWTFFYPLYGHHLLKEPLRVPISVSPPGSVQANFHIKLSEDYNLFFAFAREGVSFEKIRQIVGDGSQNKGKMGLPITIQWAIYSMPEKNLVINKETVTLNAEEWRPDAVRRKIVKLRLEPGDYQLTATVLKADPAFSIFTTQIGLGFTSGIDAPISQERKNLQWYGILFAPFVWGLDIILIVFLAKKIVNDYRNSL